MKKILNDPKNFVPEMVEGIIDAHPDYYKLIDDNFRVMASVHKTPGKVGVAGGGGSGHLPLFLGYIGKGLIDGAAIGNVFASPSAQVMLDLTKAIDAGAGVLYIYGNYGGDVMNFDMAAEMADMEDIKVLQVLATDDVASAPKGEERRRRGVGGMFFGYKIAGAAAADMLSLEDVQRVTQKAFDNMRTMGVALSSCTVPDVGHPTFTIGDDEMEIGMGIHGEPGISRQKLAPADEVVDLMLPRILEDMPYKAGDEVAVLVNSLGATPKEELYIVYRKVFNDLKAAGIKIHRPYIGPYATSMEMAGFSITLLKLDDELKGYLDAACESPFFTQN